MTEESEQTIVLLQELAALNDAADAGKVVDIGAHRRRREEISDEIKQLAREKKQK
jgi:hypothetical protein